MRCIHPEVAGGDAGLMLNELDLGFAACSKYSLFQVTHTVLLVALSHVHCTVQRIQSNMDKYTILQAGKQQHVRSSLKQLA